MSVSIHIADAIAEERAKYDEIWTIDEYRKYSPGKESVARFMSILDPAKGKTLIDFGCGDGRAGLEFEKLGLRVSWLDLSIVGLVDEVDKKRFYCQPIWERVTPASKGLKFDYGYSCDVLEHIPTEYTMFSIARMLEACSTLWLQICFREDNFGQVIDQPLHLTVKPYSWWLLRLSTTAQVVEARDLCNDGLFILKDKK